MTQTDDLEFLTKTVTQEHKTWMATRPSATLAELHQFLLDVEEEMSTFEDDDIIAEHFDELGDAAEYLSAWGDVTESVDGDELATFGYRFGNLEEDIGYVEDLINLVGPSRKLGRLRQPKKRAKS